MNAPACILHVLTDQTLLRHLAECAFAQAPLLLLLLLLRLQLSAVLAGLGR
jgi:hypothetical protein